MSVYECLKKLLMKYGVYLNTVTFKGYVGPGPWDIRVAISGDHQILPVQFPTFRCG